MGLQDVKRSVSAADMRRFTRQIIQDVRALEHMLREGMFETDVRRIGAEQELFLVDDRSQPAPVVEELLALNSDPRLVTELTRFNVEVNLEPSVFNGTCLREMEAQLNEALEMVRGLAGQVGAHPVMAGILPTIHLSDLRIENMAPMPRYRELNDVIMGLKEGKAQYQIRGTDELFFEHDNILVEGCNTSFQTHFQVSPGEFPHLYNIAQLVAAPVLAAATNSPILFGKRLWKETRIALFQQAVDTRSSNLYLRDMSPRVHFGSGWVDDSVTEIYKEDIARFRVIMTTDFDDPFDELSKGRIPRLSALQLHNGTVYRWNRACYGISDGLPHLRIENRILPAGPSVIDEVANAAFWFGVVSGLSARISDVRPLMDFDEAKSNFVAASRLGLGSQVAWVDGNRWPASDLILRELLPVAKDGLQESGIDDADVDRYLGVIEERVGSRMTGSQWQLTSLARMKKTQSTRAERLDSLVSAMRHRQEDGNPGHTWALAELEEGPEVARLPGSRVEHFMTTDLFTVHEDEAVEFVAVLMDWRRIRHVIVEDRKHRLVGLVPHRRLLRYLAEREGVPDAPSDVTVKDIMIADPVSVSPETTTIEAIKLMREKSIGALPVVREGQLVGMVTESDFARIAGKILDQTFSAGDRGSDQ